MRKRKKIKFFSNLKWDGGGSTIFVFQKMYNLGKKFKERAKFVKENMHKISDNFILKKEQYKLVTLRGVDCCVNEN